MQELAGRAGSYAILNFSGDTADPARGALLQRMQEKATAIETALLFFELEWAALDDDRAEELLATDGPGLRPPPPAHRAPLPAAPALRARGEDPHRERADRPHGVDAAVRGAGVGDHRRAPGRHRAGLARGRARRGCSRPTASCAATPPSGSRPRSSPACARARTCSTRCWRTRWSRTGCATSRTGWPAATSPTRPPTSRSRRCRGGPRALRGAAPLVPAEGAAARRSTSSPTTTGWRRSPTTRSTSAGASARDLVLDSYSSFSDELGGARAALLRRALDRRAGAPEQARRRVLRLHGALGAPVRAAQLHLQAPRRADARARARPRRARRARRAARASSTWRRR